MPDKKKIRGGKEDKQNASKRQAALAEDRRLKKENIRAVRCTEANQEAGCNGYSEQFLIGKSRIIHGIGCAFP
jgi:hypothetical protein